MKLKGITRSLGALGLYGRMAALIILPLGTEIAEAKGGTAGAILFQEPFGARPLALGQAYAALGDDIFAMPYNPASLTRLRQSQAATQFIQSISDTQIGYAALATPLNPTQAMGLSLSYLDAGQADVFDTNGSPTKSISAQRDFLAQLAYAHSFAAPEGRLHLGTGVKLLKSEIAEDMRATAYAMDVGALYGYRWRDGVASLGLAVSNLGPGIAYSGGLASGSQSDPLPLTTRMALGYAKNVFSSDIMSIGFEMDRVFPENDFFEGFGLEYNYHRLCSLRLGYRVGQDVSGLSMGLGLKFKDLSIDYGMGLFQTFNNIQQLSLNYRFRIPGIRYNQDAAPSPISVLAGRARASLSANRCFDAAAEVKRMDALFPDSLEAAAFRLEIQELINNILRQGVQTPRYSYALAFKFSEESNWEQALANLELSRRLEPDNAEIKTYLEKIKNTVQEELRQRKLQLQARTGTLFEIAYQAYEAKDLVRSWRIVKEILRLGPYQPAESLRKLIEEQGRKPASTPRPAARRPDSIQAPSPIPAPQKQPTSWEINKAEQLYYAAVRNYADNEIEKALADLREGLRLNPENESIRNTLDRIEKELKQRKKSQNPQDEHP
ncbi:MAG TPA: hypothetical protein DEB40_00020 [Elusimicrobia bacterium]|nr:hypothetical protein [Elusimicrobiota bacterium]